MTSIAHSLPETGSASLGSPGPRESPSSVALTVTALVATAAAYYLGARLGAAIRYPSSLYSVLWPPNAIVLAALLLMPIRRWWLCLAAVLPAHFAVMPAEFPWLAILGIFVTNTSQGVLSAALIRRLTRGRDTAVAYTIIFIACGVFASPILLSFADVSVLMQAGLVDDFWRAWNLRFLSNAASTIIIVPPILAAARAWQARRWAALRRLVEGIVIALGFVLLAALVVFAKPFLNTLLPLMLCSFLPLMVWAAVRFGQGGASCVTLGLVAVTVNSLSRWPDDVDEVGGLLLLQAFFLLVAILVLFLGAMHADLQRSGRALDSTMKELNSLEALSGAVLTSLNEHVAIVDRAGRILAVNDAWIRFAGASATLGQAKLSQGDDYLAVYHCVMRHSDATAAKAGIAEVLDGSKAAFRMEYECLCADPMRWFEMSVTPLRRVAGGAVISHEDITRRKQAEIELEQRRQELTHLTRVRILGELSGAMAHELHQPLTAILSNAQALKRLLSRDPLELPELHVALDDIVAADKRASDVISRLRLLLKKGEAQFQPLDVNAIINEVLELAHSDLVMRGVTTIVQLAPNLPSMRGDRVQLQQMVLNLIANACEAMTGRESDRRELTITTALSDNRTLQICVADSGSGISQDMQEHMFEPFVTTKDEGLGLGLSICHSIIAAHGGNIRAVNNLEVGASLIVMLPLHLEG